jgi:hypothetical protein
MREQLRIPSAVGYSVLRDATAAARTKPVCGLGADFRSLGGIMTPPDAFENSDARIPDFPVEVADDAECDTYEPPLVIDLGRVREVTLGSSSSGLADANSQYYW